MQTRNVMLIVGGCFSLAFAVFQASGIWWSPEAVKYLGGPAEMCASNRPLYAALCIVVAAGAAVFAFYALSGAGVIRRLPLLRTVLMRKSLELGTINGEVIPIRVIEIGDPRCGRDASRLVGELNSCSF